jgi:hypothetical protein
MASGRNFAFVRGAIHSIGPVIDEFLLRWT